MIRLWLANTSNCRCMCWGTLPRSGAGPPEWSRPQIFGNFSRYVPKYTCRSCGHLELFGESFTHHQVHSTRKVPELLKVAAWSWIGHVFFTSFCILRSLGLFLGQVPRAKILPLQEPLKKRAPKKKGQSSSFMMDTAIVLCIDCPHFPGKPKSLDSSHLFAYNRSPVTTSPFPSVDACNRAPPTGWWRYRLHTSLNVTRGIRGRRIRNK